MFRLVCTPRWQSSTADSNLFGLAAAPAVGGGKVWGLFHYTSIGTKLLAFDAAGADGCSGDPVVCSPLIEVDVPVVPYFGLALTLSADGPYVNSASVARNIERHSITAFDNSGGYRWTSGPAVGRGPIVAAGRFVYAGLPSGQIAAFDAAGVENCSPSNGFVFCSPVWTIADAPSIGAEFPTETPVVRDGRLFVRNQGTKVAVYDAAGIVGCSGAPKLCAAQWTTSTTDTQGMAVTADRLVTAGPSGVHAFSLGGASCGGAPLVCSPLLNGSVPLGTTVAEDPTVAGGVVYTPVESATVNLVAHDLGGSVGCSGVPATCSSRWSPVMPSRVWSPMVVGNTLYVAGSEQRSSLDPDLKVTAYRLP